MQGVAMKDRPLMSPGVAAIIERGFGQDLLSVWAWRRRKRLQGTRPVEPGVPREREASEHPLVDRILARRRAD
jgi:hypothetical protein